MAQEMDPSGSAVVLQHQEGWTVMVPLVEEGTTSAARRRGSRVCLLLARGEQRASTASLEVTVITVFRYSRFEEVVSTVSIDLRVQRGGCGKEARRVMMR